MNRHPFRAICAVAVSAFALLAVCGCAARPEEALNQALEALNAQQAGQFRILNLSEDGESLSVAVEYAFENGAPYFTHQGWDAEGVQSEYQYQNGKLILPEGELPETALDDTTQYRTLSEIAGVDLLQSETGPLVCEVNSNAHMAALTACSGVVIASTSSARANASRKVLKSSLSRSRYLSRLASISCASSTSICKPLRSPAKARPSIASIRAS